MIQNDRPFVATTRSSPFTTRSEIGVMGMLPRSVCHDPPSSNDTYTRVSVPAYSRPRLTGSSRMTLVKSSSGIPSVIFVHVCP